jgi:hypothetical protein
MHVKRIILAALALAFAGGAQAADARLTWWVVPPMGDIQRLPDAEPTDVPAGGVVRIRLARGEFEPGSFVVKADADLGKVAFTLGAFRNEKGDSLPAAQLDLKVVKVWYQNRNAWFSYFGDTGFKLVPELLLNDEDIIRVDEKKEANYARLVAPDGKVTERWINPPRQMDRRSAFWRGSQPFQPMKADFRDAPTLQPVRLEKGRCKQFFLTVHALADTPAGLYKGAVTAAGASIPVEIEVLPFELPAPRSYLEPTKDFYVSSYNYLRIDHVMQQNGNDRDLAVKQLTAILRDQVAHNQNMHWGLGDGADFDTVFGAMKEAGMRTDVLMAGGVANRRFKTQADLEAHARRLRAFYERKVPGATVFLGFGDEPPQKWLMESRPIFEAYRKAGFKFVIAGTDNVFHRNGYLYDWLNASQDPVEDAKPRLWNTIGPAHVAWYSTHHVGPENPSFNRRQNGLAPYLSNYSALCNYAHHLGPYNDDSTTYRPMVFAYGIYDGVIDTLQWEGFREGVDDIRYMTLMCELARAARDSGDSVLDEEGRKALLFLGGVDKAHDDQDYVRGEVIRHILHLKEILGR